MVLPANSFHFPDAKLLTLCWPCTTATGATSALSLKDHYLKIASACDSLGGFFTFFILFIYLGGMKGKRQVQQKEKKKKKSRDFNRKSRRESIFRRCTNDGAKLCRTF